MAWAIALLLLVLSMSHCLGWRITTTGALACTGEFSSGTLDEIYDIGCTGPDFADHCYVMYVVREDCWEYGCITKGSLKEVGDLLLLLRGCNIFQNIAYLTKIVI